MSSNTTARDWYRLADVHEHPLIAALGLSRRQVERAIKRGDLVAHKPGLYVMLSDVAIREWIDNSSTRRPTE